MEKNNFKYFLAANSCEGFYSVFDKSYLADGEWRAFIIKGGPGTGKSSFMKKIADSAEKVGLKTLRCPCSSDPDSLDAVILPQKKRIIMDGTAPHTVEPSYPGVCEKILNFGEFWNDSYFQGNEKNVIAATLCNKALHRTAAQYIKAAGEIMLDNYKTALACTDKIKTEQFALRLCQRIIPENKNEISGREWIRFIGGITPKGIVSFTDTIEAEVNEKIVLSDTYGSASNIIIEKIREYALKNGYEIVTLKNPFLPSVMTDHIIIPELNIAVVTENEYNGFDSKERRIHARRFVSYSQLHLSRERIKFNKKVVNELLGTACNTLSNAKAVHDELESYYIKAMDFDKLNLYCKDFIKHFTA